MSDLSFCAQFRDSGIMASAMQNSRVIQTHDSGESACPDGLSKVGSHFCLAVNDAADENANAFRCNLRCLNASNPGSSVIRKQCIELGDETCQFENLQCAAFVSPSSDDSSLKAESAAASGSKSSTVVPGQKQVSTKQDPTSEESSQIHSCNVKDDIMAMAFQKTQLLREMYEGARSDGKRSSFYNFPEVVEFGADPRMKKFFYPSSMSEKEQQKFAETIVEDFPMITSLHDKCCTSTLKNALKPTADWARKEIENIGMVLGSMEMDSAYDPMTTCPGKDKVPISAQCPNLDLQRTENSRK